MRSVCVDKRRHVRGFETLVKLAESAAEYMEVFSTFNSKYPSGAFNPFHNNELSSVGFLSGAAARLGYPSLNEYYVRKKWKDDRRWKADGRADFWMHDGALSFSFEFKRCDVPSNTNLQWCLDAALYDVSCVPPEEYDLAFAAVIAPQYEHNQRDRLLGFKESDCAFEIVDRCDNSVFLFFKGFGV